MKKVFVCFVLLMCMASTVMASSDPESIYAPASVTTVRYVYPSGDVSGYTDYTAIQSAVNSLPARGGVVILIGIAGFYLPEGKGVVIGNGTNYSESTRYGVKIKGFAPSGVQVPGVSGTSIVSRSTTVPMFTIQGPLSGWALEDLFLISSGSAPAIKVISGQNGRVENIGINVAGANQTGIMTTTQCPTCPLANTMNNRWKNVRIALLPTAYNATGIFLGSGDNSVTDTCWDTWEQTTVIPSLSNQTALHLRGADTVSFWQFGVWGNAGARGVVFDYSGYNAWPNQITFFSTDTGNSSWTNYGTPSSYLSVGSENKVFGFGTGNGARIPNLANLNIINGGK